MTRSRKFLLATLLLGWAAVGCWWLIGQVFVSDEMRDLRAIESRLDLPAHLGRTEEDSGEHTDWKGAGHNDRYILLYFGYRDSMDDIVANFESNNWVVERKTESESPARGGGEPLVGEARWSLTSDTEPACASVWRDWEPSGDISDSGVFIYHSDSDACG